MKSIGDRLKTERASKGWTIEDVARDTNIAKKYLIALESEDFSAFPAEAYMLGFLKNYGEYLGLDVKELQQLYRVLRIQEQPVPVEALLHSQPQFPKIIVTTLIVIAGLALVGGASYFIINKSKPGTSVSGVAHEPVEYVLSNESLEKRFYKGDTIVVPVQGKNYKFVISNLGEMITVSSPSKDFKLVLNDEVSVDVNSDGVNELTVAVSDYEQNRSELGVQLRFDLKQPSIASATSSTQEEAVQTAAVPSAVASANHDIFTGNTPYPFTLQIMFQGYCMFRWEILREQGREARNERYFVKGEELNIQAQNGIRIWVSNAAAVKIVAIGGGHSVPVELGTAGEVVVSDVYWTRDDGRYKLVQARLEN